MTASIILIIIASFFDAAINVLSHRFNSSVFARFSKNIIDDMWWNGEFSWKTLYRGHNQAYGRVKTKIFFVFEINKPAFMCHATGLFRLLSFISVAAAVVFYGPKYGIFIDFAYVLTVYILSNQFFKKILAK